MKLYYWPKTRAFRILWMLEELGTAYELECINIRTHEQSSPQFAAVNPMMKIPALEDGDAVFAESGAILLYLADKFPQSGLAPALNDPHRGRFLQWLFFTPACLEPAMAEKFSGWTSNSFSFGWGDFNRVIQALEEGVSPGPWILGTSFTAADILLASTIQIALQAKLLSNKPTLEDYVARAYARPGCLRAQAIETEQAARIPS